MDFVARRKHRLEKRLGKGYRELVWRGVWGPGSAGRRAEPRMQEPD